MLKFSTCYDSDPPDEVVRGLIEDEKKLFPPELRLVSPELLARMTGARRLIREGCAGEDKHGPDDH